MTALDLVLDALFAHGGDPKPSNGAFMAKCPSHADGRPSLSISEGTDGRVLLKCFAQCDNAKIVADLGLTLADLFESRPEPKSSKPKIIDTYDYLRADGTLSYQVVRFEPKDFRQRRPDGRGGWVWNLKDLSAEDRELPFMLPELTEIRGKQPDLPLVIVEGERDCLASWKQGTPATCNAGGACKWRDGHSKAVISLGFTDVVIIADRDEPGKAHALAVRDSLSKNGYEGVVQTFIATCGDGCKDLADLIAHHGEDWTEQLGDLTAPGALDVVAKPRESGLMTTRLADVRSQQTLWVWDERVPLGELTLLVGAEGQGKSTLAIELGSRLTRGQLEGDLKGQAHSVIYATSEDSASRVVRPRFEAAGADLERVFMLGFKGDPLTLSEHLDQLRKIVTTTGTRLMIIDPLVSALSDVDTYKTGPVRQVLEAFRELLESLGVACLGVIHTNRNETRVVLDRISESKAFSRVTRAAIGFGLDPNDDNARLVAQIKNNLGRMDLAVLRVRIEGRTVEDDDGEEVKTSGLVWLGEADGASAHQIFSAPSSKEENDDRSAVAELLTELLTEAPQDRATLKRTLKAEGFDMSDKTLQRALTSIGAKRQKVGFGGKSEYSLDPSLHTGQIRHS
jgi:archaellum biogenesis ATPase FlaH